MAENSKIEWTDHTFNPWIGCTKVSDGCKNCYAESLMDKRWGKVKWGPQGQRQRTSEANWKKPLQWDRQAKAQGIRYRVFCASLADVFEGNDQVSDWRLDLFGMIKVTPNLDWLLLTKRPENITPMTRHVFRHDGLHRLPDNVWIGTSVEDQAATDRIWHLINVPARVRFLSMEPLLGPVEMWSHLTTGEIDWIIVGGESGHSARPMNAEWCSSIRNDCDHYGVSFFMKQGSAANWPDYKSFDSFPADLQIREFPI